jgi:glycosyltransferase involved in cell wall biosynthesis
LEANLKISTPEDESQKKVDGTLHQESQIGINIAGYITSESGTGEAVRSNIRAFESAGFPYVLINLETQYRQEDKTYSSFSKNNTYKINCIHVNADQVPIFYSQKGDEFFKGKYNIGFWMWELSEFPKEWWPYFNYFHEIWTASSFCVDSLSAVSPIPVVRIPLSIAISRIKDVKRDYFKLPDDRFIFFFMFDMLSYFERKNPLALIEAFKTAFKPTEDVMLVLKFSNAERNPSARDRILKAANGLQIKIIDGYLFEDELHALMALSDCYVSLHRSEGFGLPLAEAMYLKKPVIATAYSGNVDFMNINNSFLIKYKMIEIEDDAGPYKKGNIWADPDPLHAAELMRYVYDNREIAQKIGEKGSEDIKSQLSPEMIGKKIRRRIERIL